MADVQIEKVVKRYGKVVAIRDVDIPIEDGEFVVLVGPSGCGKSTLLRMVAGLEDISAGTISIGGKRVNDVAAKKRDIAMVFQSYALYPHMTVRGNMSFALKLAKAPHERTREKVESSAQSLGLRELLERYPRQLSGGQRQRVAMGRAIVRDPSVFLFDEPLSNLDANLRVAMRTEIRSLHQRLGTTMIYVTHDQIEAMTMADKIVVMSGGRVEQMGPPLDLYDQPANRFVAGFLGSPSMNFFDGTITGGAFVTDHGMKLPLPPRTPQAAENRRATYGIRPEAFRIAENGYALRVDVVEPTGSETQVVGRIGADRLIATFRDRIRVRSGEAMNIQFDHAAAHLFDPDTGQRINEVPTRGVTA